MTMISEPLGNGTPQHPTRVCLSGSTVDLMDQSEAVAAVVAACRVPGAAPMAVVSANLDHVHHFGTGGRWHGVIEHSEATGRMRWLSLLDGAPLVSQAERLTGRAWPRLAGSDLIDPILDAAETEGLVVGFLGGAEETQTRLRATLAATRPSLRVGGWWAPPRKVVADPTASTRLAGEVRAAGIDVLVVGMGKPRQELWIAEYGEFTGARVLLAFGAVVDFLAGQVQRAPIWMARHGLEWSYRLVQEPRRLSRRYLVDGPVAYSHLRRHSSREPNAEPATEIEHEAGHFVDADEPAEVTVLIVTHNSAAMLPDLLADLRRESGPLRLRAVVVDNASTDGTLDAIADQRDVITVAAPNLGYAGGINAGMQHARESRAVLVLNPDLRIEDGTLLALWRRLWQPGVGVAVPRILDDDGATSASLRFEPGLLRGIGDALLGRRLPGRPTWLTEMDYNEESYQHPHPVEWATGACLMIRRDVADQVGAWDERYFLYSEEIDYLQRVRTTGRSVWYEPTAQVRHSGGGSGTSPELAALLAVNRVRYAAAHHGQAYAAGTRVVAATAELLRARERNHRMAAGYLLWRRRWSSLPKADVTRYELPTWLVDAEGVSDEVIPRLPIGSVIVPAHNEEELIEDTLRGLERLAACGAVDLVVAANGCTDATVPVAEQVGGARVLDLPEPSKARALNAGDAAAQRWPRLYLDADIAITPEAVRDVFAALSDGQVLAARPSVRDDTRGASWPVRAYYRARQRLPETTQHLWGAGAYALSRSGHERFSAFPDLVADDLFVDSLFAEAEKRVVDTDPVVVRTPRDLRGLMAVLRRTYRGNRELTGQSPATTSRTLRELAGSVRDAASLLDAVVYASLAVAGRHRASGPGARWDRDETSRRADLPQALAGRRDRRLSTKIAAATANPSASTPSPANARLELPETKVI
jgi:exopolysaccharide biosynthesis WecB/TagA/CpsF family protein